MPYKQTCNMTCCLLVPPRCRSRLSPYIAAAARNAWLHQARNLCQCQFGIVKANSIVSVRKNRISGRALVMNPTYLGIIGAILSLLITPILGNDADGKYIANKIHEVQLNLTKSFLENNHKQDSNIASVTPKKIFEKILLANSSYQVFPFNAYGKSFILAGSSVIQVSAEPHSTKQVAILTMRDPADQVAFIKTVEWRRILIIMAAFKQGYCRLYTVSPNLDLIMRQTIHNFGQARDAEFFRHDNKIFLVLVMYKPDNSLVHSFVYRWTGTHLDETESFTTSGAVAVRTFSDKSSVYIIVAQSLPHNPMVGSQVLRLQGGRLERVQFLATHGPLALQPFSAKGERFVLVLNDKEPSLTFWWSGSELLPWESLPEIHGKYEISTVHTKSQNLVVYLVKNNSITIYEANELHFRAIQKLSVPEDETDEILKVTQYANSQDVLLFISRKNNKLYFHLLKMNYVKPAAGTKMKDADPLLDCLRNLDRKLGERQEEVKYIQSLSDKLLLTNEPMKYTGKLVVGDTVEVENLSSTSVYVEGSEGQSLAATPLDFVNFLEELDPTVASSEDLIGDILYNSNPGTIYGNLLVAGDLIIHHAKSDDIIASTINEKKFEPQFWLTYSGNETMTRNVSVYTLVVHHLDAATISGKELDNLLLTQGAQVLTGNFTAPEVLAHDVEIATFLQKASHSARETFFFTNREAPKIKHVKTMNLTVESINGVNLAEFENNISMRSADDAVDKNVEFIDTDVFITDLTVNYLNGINWNDFVASLFLVTINQNVEGDVTFKSTVDINNFTVLMLNDELCENFMTKSTDQNIDSILEVDTIRANEIECADINGLEISRDVVRSGMENYISGAVTIDNLDVTGNVTVEEGAKVEGLYPLPADRLHVYTGTVTINGSLKVGDIDFGESILYIGDSTFKFNDIFNQYWTKSTEQTIPVPVEFIERLTVKGNLYAEFINGRAAPDYIHFGSTVLNGNFAFGSVRVQDSVSGDPGVTVSGIDLAQLEHEAVRLTGHYTIDGHKEFSGGLSVADLHCQNLNGVDTTNGILYLKNNGLQIRGTKYFNKLIVKGNLKSEGPINAKIVNNKALSQKLESIVFIDDPVKLENVEFLNIKAPNLKTRILNGVELDSLSTIYDSWNGTLDKVEIHGNVAFKDDLDVITVNEINVDKYFPKVLSKSRGGVVSGPLTVHGDVQVEHLHSDVVDGVNIRLLGEKALSRTKEQVITGHYTIDNVGTEHLDAYFISGVDMTKLIYINDMSGQEIHGNFIFHEAKFDKLMVDHLNKCNISKALESVHEIEGTRHFESVQIAGSLNWQHPVPEHKLLSYIFECGVKQNEEQTVTGHVTFHGNVATETLVTSHYINDVNLEFILADALRKNWDYQEINCSKYFEDKLTAKKANALGYALIKIVNDIDVLELNQSLVRGHEENRFVRGHKHFINGFLAEKLECDGRINDISPSDIATYESRNLPSTHFENLEIIKDLNFQTINSINIRKFLSERVTLKGEQLIEGNITFKGNLKLFGNTTVKQINDVLMYDVLYTRGGVVEPMSGSKTFIGDLVIEGALNAATIDGYNVSEVFTRALLVDEDAVINGNVIFMDDVTVNADLNVRYLMNGISIQDLPPLVQQDAISNLRHIDSYRRDITNSLQNSLLKVSGMASELMYFEEESSLHLVLADVRRASALYVGGGATLLSAHGWESASSCGLPEGCPCPRQHVSLFSGKRDVTTIMLDGPERQFYFMDSKNPTMAVKVTTNTLSLNKKCRLPVIDNEVPYEGTSLRWSIPNFRGEPFLNDIGTPRFAVPGYLGDAKGFKIGSTTYIILALSYDPIIDTHDMDSLVFKMTPRDLEPKLVQKLPTHGARVLEVVQQPLLGKGTSQLHLVVGNTYNSALNESEVDLYIYRFEAKREKFYLLRTYPTSGVVAVQSVVLGDETLVLIAQKYHSPLVVLKYNVLEDNYFFFQEITLDAPVLDMGVFYVGAEDAFVGAVTDSGILHLFKYAYIEGFKLVTSHMRKDARGFTPFSVASEQFVFLSSKADSQILKIVTQGP